MPNSRRNSEQAKFAQSEVTVHLVNSTCVHYGPQLKTKLQHTTTWSAAAWPSHRLCYGPAASSHCTIISTRGDLGRVFKVFIITIFYFLNYRTWNFLSLVLSLLGYSLYFSRSIIKLFNDVLSSDPAWRYRENNNGQEIEVAWLISRYRLTIHKRRTLEFHHNIRIT